MKTCLFRSGGWLVLFITIGLATISNARADSTYHFLKEIAVGGDDGWDYLTIDECAHRLYVAHGAKIVVIDTGVDTVVGEIDDTPGVHGFALAPDLGRGFSSNGKEAKASIIDLKTLKTVAKVSTGENPDAIVYAAGQKEVYAFNGKSRSATVFNAVTGKVVATIPLPGKPEFAVYDPEAARIFDNIEDKNEVVAIDTNAHRIVNTWPITPGAEASGMAIDLNHHRLFIGCHNRMMVMLDSTNGRPVASVPIGLGVDANAFDPGTQTAFSSNGDGTLTVAYEDSPNKLIVMQDVMTRPGARTMALDTQTHKIYLATASFDSPLEGEVVSTRPAPLPGTFKILVYGQ